MEQKTIQIKVEESKGGFYFPVWQVWLKHEEKSEKSLFLNLLSEKQAEEYAEHLRKTEFFAWVERDLIWI